MTSNEAKTVLRTVENGTKHGNPKAWYAFISLHDVQDALRTVADLDQKTDTVLHAGALTVDLKRRLVSIDGEVFKTSAKEFALLAYMVTEPERVWTKSELMSHVWGWPEGHQHTRTIDSHVSRLRRRLYESGVIGRWMVNVWGVGYRLTEPATV